MLCSPFNNPAVVGTTTGTGTGSTGLADSDSPGNHEVEFDRLSVQLKFIKLNYKEELKKLKDRIINQFQSCKRFSQVVPTQQSIIGFITSLESNNNQRLFEVGTGTPLDPILRESDLAIDHGRIQTINLLQANRLQALEVLKL